ncbi:MAG: queuosine precursor transporter [Spirochaetales bacterium]|nr:queuosine precursor transporter [Spirochaetales bacterium]
MSKTKFSFLELVIAGFVGLLIVSNIVSQKFFEVEFLGIFWSMDTGTLLLFPLLYIFGDILVEVWGYHTSRRVIWYGFGFNILAAVIFMFAVKLPHSEYFTYQDSFATVLGATPGLVSASMAGYWVGSFSNSFIMARMKEWMVKWDPEHKWLPLRTIASTFVGELLDTAVFVSVGVVFGIFPVELLVSLIFTQWLLKTAVEVVMTPLTVFIVRKLKKYENADVVGTETYNPFALLKSGRDSA